MSDSPHASDEPVTGQEPAGETESEVRRKRHRHLPVTTLAPEQRPARRRGNLA